MISICNAAIPSKRTRLTLSAAAELDGHGLIHVLVKIKDVFLLALATVLAARTATATSPVSTATTASTAAAAASKVAAF